MKTPWFKLEPQKLLSEIIDLSNEERGSFLVKLCQDLTKGSSDNALISEMIEERSNYIGKKAIAGKKGMEKRYKSTTNNDNSVITVLDSDITKSNKVDGCYNHNITLHNNTDIKDKEKSLKEKKSCDLFLDTWNKISWTKNYSPTSESVRSKIDSNISKIAKEHDGDFFSDLKKALEEKSFMKGETWFNGANVSTRKDILGRFISGTYDFKGGSNKSPNTPLKNDISGFYKTGEI